MKYLIMISMITFVSCGKGGTGEGGSGAKGIYGASAANTVRCYEGTTLIERSSGNVEISAEIDEGDRMEVNFEREGCTITNVYNVSFDGDNLQISGVSSTSSPSGCQISASYPGLSTDTETITEDDDIAGYSENYPVKSGDVEIEAQGLNSGDLECFYTLSKVSFKIGGSL